MIPGMQSETFLDHVLDITILCAGQWLSSGHLAVVPH